MRHNPIDQVYAEIVAARERKVTLIIEAIKNLRRNIESKQAQIDKHQAKVAALELEAEYHRLFLSHTLPRIFHRNFKGTGYVLSGTWRILSAGCPAEWHKEQAGMGMEDREDNPAFLTPSGKWLIIVTDIGEVLGFEIVRDIQ